MKLLQTFLLTFLLSHAFLNVNAQDWANLNLFKQANMELPPLEKDEDRIVFLGNSITIGWSETHPEFFKNKPYVNRGISGQTTPHMLLRFRQDVINIGATAVVILAGTNDIAENTGPITLEMILDNLKSMTELARANDIKVILCSVLPAYDYPWRPGLQPNIKIPKLNALIKNYAQKNGIYYLDYFSAINDGNNGMVKKYSPDGVHLSLEGYRFIEPMVEKALTEVLSK